MIDYFHINGNVNVTLRVKNLMYGNINVTLGVGVYDRDKVI